MESVKMHPGRAHFPPEQTVPSPGGGSGQTIYISTVVSRLSTVVVVDIVVIRHCSYRLLAPGHAYFSRPAAAPGFGLIIHSLEINYILSFWSNSNF